MKNFFRKVAFGIGANEQIPTDPLKWAQNQITDTIPEFSYTGKIFSEEELRKHYRKYVMTERNKLRKEFKSDKMGYEAARNKLRDDTGMKFWKNLELAIRHKEATMGEYPVFTKLWYFWTNHFTIMEKDHLQDYTTGAYQRETIRANLNKTFEELTLEATIAWTMIHHLDNSLNVGPKSEDARAEWRKRKKQPATINENHARELLELHTVSPNSGYTQDNIKELALIMTGWARDAEKWRTQDETADVKFQREFHEPGKKIFWGKEFPKGKKGLPTAINFLANHASSREFIAYKLCRYLITDYPTEEMTKPIVKAWEQSDGYLPEIHKAAIEVAFKFNDNNSKFQTPENWWLQMSRMTEAKWPDSDEKFDSYQLGYGLDPYQAKPSEYLWDMGHHPYLAAQPNGYSDLADDWTSPELIIRRFLYARQGYINLKPANKNDEFYEKVVINNFDKPDEIFKHLNKIEKTIDKHIMLFNLPEVIRA